MTPGKSWHHICSGARPVLTAIRQHQAPLCPRCPPRCPAGREDRGASCCTKGEDGGGRGRNEEQRRRQTSSDMRRFGKTTQDCFQCRCFYNRVFLKYLCRTREVKERWFKKQLCLCLSVVSRTHVDHSTLRDRFRLLEDIQTVTVCVDEMGTETKRRLSLNSADFLTSTSDNH